jgi:hypothetical protein
VGACQTSSTDTTKSHNQPRVLLPHILQVFFQHHVESGSFEENSGGTDPSTSGDQMLLINTLTFKSTSSFSIHPCMHSHTTHDCELL